MGNFMMYCTYAHSTTDGKVFYIGKGTRSRPYSKSDRSISWKNVVKASQGYAIAVLALWKTEDEAYEHEKFLISCFRSMGTKLVNLTSGGKGVNDYCQSLELRKAKSLLLKGYIHKTVTCPNCGHTGGETAMKRWHFDKCTGEKIFKARVSINGKRVFLGNYASKEDVAIVVEKYLKEQTVTVSSGSTWVVV